MGLRRSDIVLWLAWVVAGALAGMMSIAAQLRAFGVSFGYSYGSIGFELSLLLVVDGSLAIFQFAVLRAGVGSRTLPAIVWATVTVTASLGDYAATYVLLSSTAVTTAVPKPLIEIAIPVALALLGGFVFGVVLWTIVHQRSAILVWPAASIIALMASYAVFAWTPFLQLANRLPLLAELLIETA